MTYTAAFKMGKGTLYLDAARAMEPFIRIGGSPLTTFTRRAARVGAVRRAAALCESAKCGAAPCEAAPPRGATPSRSGQVRRRSHSAAICAATPRCARASGSGSSPASRYRAPVCARESSSPSSSAAAASGRRAGASERTHGSRRQAGYPLFFEQNCRRPTAPVTKGSSRFRFGARPSSACERQAGRSRSAGADPRQSRRSTANTGR